MKKKSLLYIIFCVALLSTEFFYIEILGGLRPYHLISPIVILLLFRYFSHIARSGVFWVLMAFLTINLIATLFAEAPTRALLSFGLLLANVSLAISIALIIVSGRIDIDDIFRIALVAAVFSILFGASQLAVYKTIGVNLGLSEFQALQIEAGFSSGLRTEANAFAKSLNILFLLNFPIFLASKNSKRALFIAFILIIGMLLSLTRSTLYGMSLTLMLVYLWYLVQGKGRFIAPRPLILILIASLALFVFSIFADQFNEYATHKLITFFNKEEILEGGSSGFRLMSQKILIDTFMSSYKTQIIGTGWGQVKFFAFDQEMSAGGGELITALTYGGIFSGILYLLYNITAIYIAWKRATKTPKNQKKRLLYEGVTFALIGTMITGQINGALILPDYWMLFGMAIALSYKTSTLYRSKNKKSGPNQPTSPTRYHL